MVAGNFAAAPKGVPLGELAATKGSRLRGLLGLTASTPSVIAYGDATFPKGTAEPSQSRLTACQLPRGGSFMGYTGNFFAAAEAFTLRGKVAHSAG